MHLVRYEDLVRSPGATLEPLAKRVGVDADAFDLDIAHDRSVGSFRSRLTRAETASVEQVAGAAMDRLGYA